MSKKGENITKRKDGRWEARVLKGYRQDGRAIYKSLYASSYSQVKAKKTEYLSVFNFSELKNNENGIFDTVLSLFLQYKKYQVKESTYACYSNIIEKHIRPSIGILKIKKIDSTVIERFIDEKLNYGRIDRRGGLSRKTVKDMLTVLSLVLKYANKTGLMNVGQIHYSLPKIEKQEIEIFTAEEELTLINFALSGNDFQKFGVCLALYTGLRIGELCALQWGSIDLENSLIFVKNTLMRISDTDKKSIRKTKIIIDSPKTVAGRRAIPIPSFLLPKLYDLYGDYKNKQDYFLTGTSKYIEPSNYYVKYQKWLRDIHLSERSFHSLRHTFATRCVESGFDVKTLSEVLGHADVNVTLNRYVHSSIELKRLNMEKLSVFYPQSIPLS
ncbi:MAG: site-specific integrase [Clostridia bacterium]|nr:site-specific integrase [Clostridia bacterium]